MKFFRTNVESIVKMSAEDAAKSLCEKGVEVTARQLIEFRDFAVAHKDELQNGELDEERLSEVSGGITDSEAEMLTFLYPLLVLGGTTAAIIAAIFW